MSTLAPDRLAALRTRLEDLVRELTEQIEGTRGAAGPVDLDEPIGRVSRIDAIQQQSMIQANRNAARQRLALARAALERIDADEYGECASCGEEIAPARLEASPESALCVECQGRRESRR
jgi:DnaK suppressor protein